MHADRNPASARGAIVACERRLMALVEPTVGIERERMCRNNKSVEQAPAKIVDVH